MQGAFSGYARGRQNLVDFAKRATDISMSNLTQDYQLDLEGTTDGLGLLSFQCSLRIRPDVQHLGHQRDPTFDVMTETLRIVSFPGLCRTRFGS